MKIIEWLSDHIDEEIADAHCYAKKAIEMKESNRSLADALYKLSNDEMTHSDALHAEVVKIIEDYRRTDGEPPESMKAVYEYLHDKHIEKAKEARMLQAMYRGQS